MLICNRLSCIALNDAAYSLLEEGWFRSMLFSVNITCDQAIFSFFFLAGERKILFLPPKKKQKKIA